MYRTVFTPKHYHRFRRFRGFFVGIGLTLWTLATIFALTPMLPHLLYRLSPQTPATLAQTIGKTVTLPTSLIPPNSPISLPPTDSTLPEENYLFIPKIGVAGLIHEGSDWEKILQQGIWRVPEFATPESGRPIILASHRWGYLAWSNAFRRANSFYSLPNLKIGDEITIAWAQRSYRYEVTKTESSEGLSDYSQDLILYTCQLWNSPIRIVVYAKRTN